MGERSDQRGLLIVGLPVLLGTGRAAGLAFDGGFRTAYAEAAGLAGDSPFGGVRSLLHCPVRICPGFFLELCGPSFID